MSESLTLTQAATAAAQFLGVLDSGESLSAQQLTDALAAANNLLANWTNEQVLALQLLIAEQSRDGAIFVDGLTKAAAPQVQAYTLAGGNYGVAVFQAPTYNPGATPQFPDTVTAINVPNGYARAIKLGLAVEIGPQYDIQPSAALLKDLAEARAAASPMPNRLPTPGESGMQQGQ